jgi:hypothetical protein
LLDTQNRKHFTFSNWLYNRENTLFFGWLNLQLQGDYSITDFKTNAKINFRIWLSKKTEASDCKSHYTFKQFYLYELEVKAHLKWVWKDMKDALIKIPFEDWLNNQLETTDICKFREWR